MDTFSIIAFTFALSALAFSVKNHERINKLENKLKDFDVIPREFSSEPTPGKQKPED
ncbi:MULTISPECIES: hypothetical protein [Oleiagrimonas]|jgi:hypothetical protein|uniref:Uncharacterized protein n=1 Tax=Oleiagrimonas citrea TaxID=1665687 RepID=A0A846ZJ29_9GAMM|nr:MULTISPECIES: hypothetical protein [Oleiagrimonas]NKZ37593.1 hypothetical protein [Oleiagrimonas citrea]